MNHLSSVLDFIHRHAVFEFKNDPLTRHRAYFNVVCCAFVCFILSRISLNTGQAYPSITTFHVSNSWMHIGFRPYMCLYFLGYFFESDRYKSGRMRVLFLMSTFLYFYDKSWTVCAILLGVSFLLVHMDAWLARTGSISLNSLMLLIVFCRDNCVRPLSWVCLCSIVYLNMSGITLPMVHMKRRLQPQTAKLPLLYNGGGPLVMYVRIVELMAMFWFPIGKYLLSPPLQWVIISEALKIGVVYVLSQYWTKWYERTGFDLAKKWNKQHFTLKGWRSAGTMGKYLQRLIERNIRCDTVLTCIHSVICVFFSIRPASIWLSISTMNQIKEAAN